MEVKGTAIRSIDEFIKKKFTTEYNNWLQSLPKTSKLLFYNGIASNKWYNIDDAAIIPTTKIGEIFFDNDIKKGAWECGRYSAESALSGIYKIYIKLSKPGHIIERASRIFSAYYKDSVMKSKKSTDSSVIIVIEDFPKPSDVIEYRIAGWIEKALEMSGCKELNVKIETSLVNGDDETLYNITWKN